MLFPQLIKVYRASSHSATKETANLLMLRQDLHLLNQMEYHPLVTESQLTHAYRVELLKKAGGGAQHFPAGANKDPGGEPRRANSTHLKTGYGY